MIEIGLFLIIYYFLKGKPSTSRGRRSSGSQKMTLREAEAIIAAHRAGR